MRYGRLHVKLLRRIAIVGVPLLALAGFHARSLVRSGRFVNAPRLQGDAGDHEIRGDQPDKAIEWRLMRMRDENGQIPDGALLRARQQMDAMRAAQATLPQPSAANTTINWTALGPGNIGGRVRSIAIHPNNPNTMFAGSAGGGIWKTTDGGASWSPVNDFMANRAVTSIVFMPTNPTVMYAGTGEGFAIGIDGIRGAGVFKSTDGGAMWNQLGSTANPNFYYVNRVAVSPDGATLLAATTTGIYRSTDGGATFPAATLAGRSARASGRWCSTRTTRARRSPAPSSQERTRYCPRRRGTRPTGVRTGLRFRSPTCRTQLVSSWPTPGASRTRSMHRSTRTAARCT